MRILELTWEYPPHIVGGIGAHVSALVPALNRLGASVAVLTPRLAGGAEREDAPGLRVQRVDPGEPHGDFFESVMQTNERLAAAAFERYGGDFPFDIIHAHDWLVGPAAARLKNRYKVPLLATIHATERGRNGGSIQNPLSNAISSAEWDLTYQAWRVVTVSRPMAAELQTYFSLPADKIDVVPNGVDTSPFDALDGEDLAAYRARHAAPGEPVVLNVGRMVYEKGAHVLVEAIPSVLAKFPQTRFVLAGRGGMLEALRARAEVLGIMAHCTFAGFIDDMERDLLLKVADCAVFPSLYEPFGIVALEAMAARCPVVVSAVGGLAEVVRSGENGLSVPPSWVKGLADAINLTLADPLAARARATRAYDDVRRRYNWGAIAQQKLAIMQRIVDERARTDW